MYSFSPHPFLHWVTRWHGLNLVPLGVQFCDPGLWISLEMRPEPSMHTLVRIGSDPGHSVIRPPTWLPEQCLSCLRESHSKKTFIHRVSVTLIHCSDRQYHSLPSSLLPPRTWVNHSFPQASQVDALGRGGRTGRSTCREIYLEGDTILHRPVSETVCHEAIPPSTRL